MPPMRTPGSPETTCQAAPAPSSAQAGWMLLQVHVPPDKSNHKFHITITPNLSPRDMLWTASQVKPSSRLVQLSVNYTMSCVSQFKLHNEECLTGSTTQQCELHNSVNYTMNSVSQCEPHKEQCLSVN